MMQGEPLKKNGVPWDSPAFANKKGAVNYKKEFLGSFYKQETKYNS
jgi:hypothetical protein